MSIVILSFYPSGQMDGFNRLMFKARDISVIEVFYVENSGMIISYLQFVDNIPLFMGLQKAR